MLKSVPVSDTSTADAYGFSYSISLPIALALAIVLVAITQGILLLESAENCRISIRKLRILGGLEVLEILLLGLAGVETFLALQSTLKTQMQWLHFVPWCALVVGFFELLADLVNTVQVASGSWRGFRPVAVFVGKIDLEFWSLVPNTVASLALVGWRQLWWWDSDLSVLTDAAANAEAVAAAEGTLLSTTAVGLCMVWALFWSFYSVSITILADWKLSDLKPADWLEDRQVDEDIEAQYEWTAKLQATSPMAGDALKQLLQAEPVRIGNVVVGDDRYMCSDSDSHLLKNNFLRLLSHGRIHLAAAPLLILVLAAVIRLRNKIDVTTLNGLRQLVDVALVISFFEVAVGIKRAIWSVPIVKHSGERPKKLPRRDCFP